MSRHAFRSVDLPSLHPNRVPAHRAPKHRSNRLEDSCSLACNAGYESGGDCSTYLGRHDAQPFVTAINVISRLYARQLDAYCIGDPA